MFRKSNDVLLLSVRGLQQASPRLSKDCKQVLKEYFVLLSDLIPWPLTDLSGTLFWPRLLDLLSCREFRGTVRVSII